MSEQAILFEEEQSFASRWLLIVPGVPVLILLATFLPAYLAGAAVPVEAVVAGVVVPGFMLLLVAALLLGMKLRVTVDGHRLHVRFTPFVDREIPLKNIRSWEPRTYRPIVEYGGWGIRYGLFGKGQAYNTRGNRGVQLELSDGSRLLIGSQRAEELAQAITQARGR